MSSELAIWTNSQTTTLEKRKTAQESSRKTKGSILKSLPLFLTVPPSKSLVFDKKAVLRALQKIPIVVRLLSYFGALSCVIPDMVGGAIPVKRPPTPCNVVRQLNAIVLPDILPAVAGCYIF